MSETLLGILIASCLLVGWWGLQRDSRMIQYPFLVAAVYLGWMVPQLLGLTQDPHLPEGVLSKTIFMAILCLGAVYFGYTARPRPARMLWWRYDERRLMYASVVLSLLGAFFFFQISRIAAEVTAAHGGAWTGVITIYGFLARLLTVGLVVAIILHLKTPRWQTLIVIGFDLLFYLDRVIIKGRRAAMIELALIALMALWFQRRWLPPRWIIIVGLVGGALLINSIGDYRATMLGEDRTTWSGASLGDILEIDFLGNLKDIAEGESQIVDLKNAAMNIEAADQSGGFDYWLTLWNQFVKQYVPGQWIGHDMKQSLLFHFDYAASTVLGYIPRFGSTPTGLSDAFQSFWYFGFIKFFLAGLIMGRWFRAGEKGNIAAQMIIMLIISDSLHLITHSTGKFYMGFIEIAAFLLPVLIFAQVKQVKSVRVSLGAVSAGMREAAPRDQVDRR